jgi:hypothetical protein
MKIPAGALAQSHSETDSLASGGTSRGGHDGNFAQMFRKSLGKSQATSSTPAQSTTQETQSVGALLPVQLHRVDAVQPEAPAASLPQTRLSLGTRKTEAASQAAAVLSGSGTGGTPRTRASKPAATATTTTATTGLGDSGSDSTPLLLSHASRAASVASYQASSSARTAPAAQTAAQPSAAAIYRSAGDLRALGSKGTNAGVTITTAATASERLIVVQKETSSPAAPARTVGTDNTPRHASRASGAPLAPFGDNGTDNTPRHASRASGAPIAATGSGDIQGLARIVVDSAPANATAPGWVAAYTLAPVVGSKPATPPAKTTESNATHRLAQIAVDSRPATATASESTAAHRLAQIAVDSTPAAPTAATVAVAAAAASSSATVTPSATKSSFGGSGSDRTSHLPAHATSAPVAPLGDSGSDGTPVLPPRASHAPVAPSATTAAADLAPLAAHATQPAELVDSALPSLKPAAHDDSAAPTQVPQAAVGATSHSAKPAQAVPPPAAATAAVTAQPAADAKPPTGPILQPLSEPAERMGALSAEERTRAQDSTDDPSAEQSPSLPIFVTAQDSTASSLPIHHMREGERAAVPDHSRALPTSEGKQTGQAPHVSLPDQAASGQTRLHAETQVTPSTPQAPPQFTLPVHAHGSQWTDQRGGCRPAIGRSPAGPRIALAAQVAQNDGLSMTVMPHAAHMAIESPDGDLDLRMRVQHGSAEITVGGSMAPPVPCARTRGACRAGQRGLGAREFRFRPTRRRAAGPASA